MSNAASASESVYAAIGKQVLGFADRYKSFLTVGECFLACNDTEAASTVFNAFADKVLNERASGTAKHIRSVAALYGVTLKNDAELKDAVNYVLSAALVAAVHADVVTLVKEKSVLSDRQSSIERVGEGLLNIYRDKQFTGLLGIRNLYEEAEKVKIRCASMTGIPIFSTNVTKSAVYEVDAQQVVEGLLLRNVSVGKGRGKCIYAI